MRDKLISSFLVATARHVRCTQNNNFAKSLEYLRKEQKVEDDFLHSNKHQTFLHVDAIKFGWKGQSFPKYPK